MSSLTGLPRDVGIQHNSFLPPFSEAAVDMVSSDQPSSVGAVDLQLGQQGPSVQDLGEFQNTNGQNSQEHDRSLEGTTNGLKRKREELGPQNRISSIDQVGSKAIYLAQAEWRDRCIGLCALLHTVALFKDAWVTISANKQNCYEVAKAIIRWMKANADKLKSITVLSSEQYRWKDLPASALVPKPQLGNRVKVLNCIPCEISYFPNLQSCKFNGNLLTDLPEEMGTLPIQSLDLSGNSLKSIPLFLAEMPKLQDVDLALTQIDFSTFAKFIIHCCDIGREAFLRFKFDQNLSTTLNLSRSSKNSQKYTLMLN